MCTNDYITIKPDGNVGIGTGAQRKLHVKDTGDCFIRIQSGVDKEANLEFYDTEARWQIYKPDNSTDLRFWDKTADRVTFKRGGNVGIGTTEPGSKLEVLQTDTTADNIAYPLILDHRLSSGTPVDGIGTGIRFNCQRSIGDDAIIDRAIATVEAYGASGIPGSADRWNLRFTVRGAYDANETPLVLKHNGNVGIGTDDPQQKLEVHGNILLGKNDVDSFMHSGASMGLSADKSIRIIADSNDTIGQANQPDSDIIFGFGSTVNTDSKRNFQWNNQLTFPRNEAMRIKEYTNGTTRRARVGIGTNDPQTSLDRQGD